MHSEQNHLTAAVDMCCSAAGWKRGSKWTRNEQAAGVDKQKRTKRRALFVTKEIRTHPRFDPGTHWYIA